MSADHTVDPSVHIADRTAPAKTIVAGFSAFGLAGLTAADYLVDHLELAETGHVTVESLPSITPFEEGRPRHHSRFFSRPGFDLTVFVNELFLPTYVADPFAEALLDWTDEHGVNAALMHRGIESSLRTAVFVTPVHAQVPDVPAAIRLIEAFDRVYDLGVDAEPLEGFARTIERYYQDLAARLSEVDERQRPEDRMYM